MVEAEAPRLLPVRIVSTAADAGTAPGFGIEIVLAGGRRIRVAEAFDPETLGRVIKLLERPTC
jgi:hypothetical protein